MNGILFFPIVLIFTIPIDFNAVLMDIIALKKKIKTINLQLFDLFLETYERMKSEETEEKIILVAESLIKSEDKKLMYEDLVKLIG